MRALVLYSPAFWVYLVSCVHTGFSQNTSSNVIVSADGFRDPMIPGCYSCGTVANLEQGVHQSGIAGEESREPHPFCVPAHRPDTFDCVQRRMSSGAHRLAMVRALSHACGPARDATSLLLTAPRHSPNRLATVSDLKMIPVLTGMAGALPTLGFGRTSNSGAKLGPALIWVSHCPLRCPRSA